MGVKGLHEWKARIRDFFKFSKRERRDLIISILVVTLIFAFNDKSDVFVLSHWLFNYFKVLVIVSIAMMLHVTVQKLAALYMGFTAEYKISTMGIYAGLIVMLLTKGKWYIILPGGIFFDFLVIQRLGHFRYGLTLLPSGIIAALGPLSNLVIATIWETIALWGIYPEFFHQMTFINLYYAFFSMMPLPKTDGVWLFFGSRLTYFFFFGVLFGYILLYAVGIFSLIWAVVLGGVTWFLFLWFFERQTKVVGL